MDPLLLRVIRPNCPWQSLGMQIDSRISPLDVFLRFPPGCLVPCIREVGPRGLDVFLMTPRRSLLVILVVPLKHEADPPNPSVTIGFF